MRITSFVRSTCVGVLLLVPHTVVAREEAPEPGTSSSASSSDPSFAALVAYVTELERADGANGSAPADEAQYKLVEVPSDEIDKYMPVAPERNGAPQVLEGLWWMDGNPLPDGVISFGASTWDPVNRTTSIRVYGEGVWSWQASPWGKSLYHFIRNSELVYELRFNEDLDYTVITPVVRIGRRIVRVPEQVVKFTARLVEDGHWLRESYVAGVKVHTYDLRRIVRGNGEREPTFDKFVKKTPPFSLIAKRIR